MAKVCSRCGMRLSFLRRLDFDCCVGCELVGPPTAAPGLLQDSWARATELCRSAPATPSMADAPALLPPTTGRWFLAVIAGVLAFLACWAIGVGVTILIVRAIPPEVPNPTEAYEGFGDYMLATIRFFVGAVVSFVAAVVAGLLVSRRIAYR